MEAEQPMAVETLSSSSEPKTIESPTEQGKQSDSVETPPADKEETTPLNTSDTTIAVAAPVENAKVGNEASKGEEPSATVPVNELAKDLDMECDSAPTVDTTLISSQQQDSSQKMDCETQEGGISKIPPGPSAAQDSAAKSTSGLGLLAAYDSGAEESDVEEVHRNPDSDNEVIEVPVTDTTTYRRPVVDVSSSSDASASSSSSDSDSDSEGEYLTVLRKKIEKKINTEDCDEDDDDFDEDGASGDRPRRRQPPKVRGEMLLDDLPPIHQLEITVPEDECVELGKVHSIVDQLVLVSVIPNSSLFDLDTVLFLEKGRKVLGEVFDVLGQVADPLYCVRFNSNKEIKDRGINIGDVVYCAPKTEHTQFVILSKLMKIRGSDASWEHDVEPPERYIDYSDDEAQREAKHEQRKRRQRDRTNSTDSVDTVTSVATTATEASVAAPPPRQRGRRGQRESFRQNQRNSMPQNNQNSNQQRDQQYNYHPSYNPGSWHSNYYHNYHQPPTNFNMPPHPGMHFPMPNYGYGMPYAVPPMMPMNGSPHPHPPHHMYPPPPPFAPPPAPQNGHPPPS
ncbi:H/ACA ribonucleoprotein complex non-core subunit NAF1 [Drosophila bipectinata]|uniref:H/ACA ribonucleoprotein complex non-core subunit NAF1 n=1 Tax=Drosophila bipectinata TaxID=42026 RepID=UPI001C8A3473|nr:H/ACA ribonucleoprotein complex non-core subunit NAF1 [Drosophila bipectinata]